MKTKEEMQKEDREYYEDHPFYVSYEEIRRRDAETMRRRANGK